MLDLVRIFFEKKPPKKHFSQNFTHPKYPPSLSEEMDAKVTLGREKKGSRPPPVYPSKNLTDEEMLRTSNVSLTTITPGDPQFGSI